MNVNNSGSSLVIDPKSQAAIDAVRDRITLLDSENARLTKLKAVLEDSVRKVEADLDYKNNLLIEIDAKVTAATALLEGAITSESEVRSRVETLKATEEQIKRDLDEQADALIAREKTLDEEARTHAATAEALEALRVKLTTEEAILNTKKENLQDVLAKL